MRAATCHSRRRRRSSRWRLTAIIGGESEVTNLGVRGSIPSLGRSCFSTTPCSAVISSRATRTSRVTPMMPDPHDELPRCRSRRRRPTRRSRVDRGLDVVHDHPATVVAHRSAARPHKGSPAPPSRRSVGPAGTRRQREAVKRPRASSGTTSATFRGTSTRKRSPRRSTPSGRLPLAKAASTTTSKGPDPGRSAVARMVATRRSSHVAITTSRSSRPRRTRAIWIRLNGPRSSSTVGGMWSSTTDLIAANREALYAAGCPRKRGPRSRLRSWTLAKR